ncbi:MAG: hypothetical protein NTW19_16275 [Planctomycetota bacterium]|nr:hypothetical protein [Planctomycetota bacterium]
MRDQVNESTQHGPAVIGGAAASSIQAPSAPDGRGAGSLWILDTWRDLLLFIGTPLLLVPLFGLLRTRMSAPDIYLYVSGFGAMGHHLPGMMRAYGDRELLSRFRARFLVAPIVLALVAAYCSINGLHVLELVLLLWGIWHGMAQVYGFGRIYDAKVKSFAPLTARLDLLLLASWFGAAAFFTPLRMPQVLLALYQCGVPLLSPATISTAATAWYACTAVITAAFAANAFLRWRRG